MAGGQHERMSGLEGVRPKQAACLHCGYQLGGIAIRKGCIVCPECAGVTRFDSLPAVRRPSAHRWAWLVVRLMVLAVLGAAAWFLWVMR